MKGPRSIAVVSGKGGSGKTMVSTVIGVVLAEQASVVLMDADIGTAGLTYYMGVEYVRNTRIGLSSTFHGPSSMDDDETGYSSLPDLVQPVRRVPGLNFFGIGDHRQLQRLEAEKGPRALVDALKETVSGLVRLGGVVVVDCRGGIDAESLAVCEMVDDVLLVTEPDITAYQATRNMVNVLSDAGLGHKLRGFILNKVFQDPSYIQSRGTAEFGCQHLCSIPYDIQSTRSFFIGDIPSPRSTFYTHVKYGVHRMYPDDVEEPQGRVWGPEDFDRVAIADPDGTRGGNLSAGVLLLLAVSGLVIALSKSPSTSLNTVFLLFAIIFGVTGSMAGSRQLLGRLVGRYIRLLNRAVRPKPGRQS